MVLRQRFLAAASASVLVLAVRPGITRADDLPLVRVGTAQAVSLAFLPIQVGEAAGIWRQAGIRVESSALRGDAQVQQALASDSIDIGLGSGPGLGFLAKGVPAIGIAALAGSPYNMALMVPLNSPINSAADLKGKRIGVTTAGSLTDWLTKQIAVEQGWDSTVIATVPLGDTKAQVAAMKTNEIDGFIAGTELGYDLQERQQAKVIMTFGTIVKHFVTHVIFARNDMVADHPDLVKKFLIGWFRSVAYMRSHRAESITIAAKYEGVSESSMGKSYDAIMGMMSSDGAWNNAALDEIASSLVDLKILDTKPNPETLITRKFVPVHI
jgi:ABC-type nitrate/sulfonate/bicarbonate transport system substrate-binding protein